MKLIVKTHKIEIAKEPINEKEINITKCEFEFADEIGNDFVKEAFFTYNGTTYKEIIVNNQCDIPYEVLIEKGQVELGVVAYKIENDVEIKRYNPSPVYFNTWDGSLKEQYENSEPITPTDKEQIEQLVTNALDEANTAVENANTALNQANNLDLDVSKEDKTATVSITKKDGTQKSVNIFDGVSLQFMWQGTSLGVKTEDMQDYVFVDLQGIQGQPGPQGEAFQIKKTYATTQLMIADYDNMNINDYVMISGDIETQDNATLWVKTETEDPTYRWVYLADFSGASGIQGETGATPQISIGTVTSGQTPSVTISGTAENPVFNFVLVKGDTGATGQTGATGATGNGISSIEQTSATTSEKNFRINYTNGGHFDYSLENGEVTQSQLDEVQAELDRYKLIENALPHVSGTGTSITIDNTAKSPMSLDLAPSELSQVTTTGKNKLNVNKTPEYIYGSTEYVMRNNEIQVKNNKTGTYSFIEFYIDNLEPNTQYTVSFDAVVSNSIVTADIMKARNNGSAADRLARIDGTTTGNYTGTFTTPSDTSTMSIMIYSLRGTYQAQAATTYTNLMIRLSSVSDTSYEPYTGGIPQPNPTYPSDIHVISGDNNVVVQNKNLVDRTKATLGKAIHKSGAMLNDTNSDVSDYIDVGGISSVVISFTTSLDSFSWGICCYDKNKNALSDYGANGVGKSAAASGRLVQDLITNNIKYLRFSYPKDSTDVMLEVNTTKTSYVAHQEQVKPITLPVKNLFDKDNATYKNNYYKNDSGVETSSTVSGYTTSYVAVKPNTKYTMQGTITEAGTNTAIYFYDNSKNWLSRISNLANTDYPYTFTTPSNCYYMQFQYKVSAYNADTMQIEQGSKANSYTPFGTTPIEYCKIGDYKDEFVLGTGKNLTNPATYVKGQINSQGSYGGDEVSDFSISGDKITFTTTSTYRGCVSDYIEVEENTFYACSFESSSSIATFGYANFYDESKTFISRLAFSQLATNSSPANSKYVRLLIGLSSTGTTTISKIMFEKGSTSTYYEPYGSKDKWLIKKNIQRIDNAETLIGNTSIGGDSNRYFSIPKTSLGVISEVSNTGVMLCNKFSESLATPRHIGQFQTYANNNNVLFIIDSQYDTIAKIQAAYPNITTYGAGGTPYCISLPTTLQNQIEDIYNTMLSYQGQTNVSQVNNDLPFVMTGRAVKDISNL